jgi:hypothetical protein
MSAVVTVEPAIAEPPEVSEMSASAVPASSV